MIHAAIMGSIERFMSIFIEHHAGHFPLWLAPSQVAILPVAEAHEKFAADLGMKLMEKGLRTEYFNSEQTLGKRIREAEQQRIPYILVIGDREVQENTVAVRNVRTKQQVTVLVEEFIEKAMEDVRERHVELAIG